MRLAQTKQIVSQIKELYKNLDASAARGVEFSQENGRTLSCQKGCAACCHIMTLATIADALVIALPLFRKPDWRSLLPALRLSAQEMSAPITEGTYARKHLPCVFLKGNECSVYEDRPSACRFYLVFSPVEKCDAELEGKNIISLDTTAMKAEALRASVHFFGDTGWVLAPLPLMVLHAMRLIANKPGEQAELDAAIEGLVDPEDWFQKKISRDVLEATR